MGFAKRNAGVTDLAHYGAGLSEINAGTGYGTGYTLSANVVKGRKSLELGIIYSERESKFSGGDFKYRIYLGNISRIENENKLYKPYLQYNLLYENTTSTAPSTVDLGGSNYEIGSDPTVVCMIGHFISYGNKIKFLGNTYIDSSLGFGVYKSSADNNENEGSWAIQGTNENLTYTFKIGLGYTFN
jgi:hypothetical protein